MNNRIWLYDTTLRDGAQSEGLCFSLEDKLRIARKLDEMGIPFIEGGWPGANPKDVQFFWELQEKPLTQAEIVAFCSTRRPHKTAAEEALFKPILAAGTRWVAIFGKSWDFHVTEGLKTSLDENLNMIADTVTYLRSQGRRVVYDAEHWFDGYQHNPDYALQTLRAALNAGAEWLVFCDTNGGTLPHDITRIVREVLAAIPELAGENPPARLGIHPHNDAGTAVANALAAVIEGAQMVQGTINGYGERCGNANLCTLIPNLQLKLGYDCIDSAQLQQLTPASHFIGEVANVSPDERAPFVGRSAFAHKGGIHVSAVARNPKTYEHTSPESVGNERRISISEQSGMSNVVAKARNFGVNLEENPEIGRAILQRLKQLEGEGYQFEAAEASFELLVRSLLGQRPSIFEIEGFQIHCNLLQGCAIDGNPKGDRVDTHSLATIKVGVNGEQLLEVAEGNGPVAALDAALRKALVKFYPEIADFYLTDYKVRILDGRAGTSAKTRVLVESSNGERRWTTLGVSANIIDASYRAVVEGIEYGLLLQSPISLAAISG
ncbi:citramalate synthase [Oscillatoria sp. FACHB-1406]|uniref:citramalate synthase n=1 Tax=Oscillatoria sp. FACHB-1406 TaxID=2692846 RepID=UPI001682D427|nr:citramalate synthase [Oscillatoria sp. FACHB-1406]MBD2576600.1 citramalate synthase [Oscillatoria sp. FACHB-1406]